MTTGQIHLPPALAKKILLRYSHTCQFIVRWFSCVASAELVIYNRFFWPARPKTYITMVALYRRVCRLLVCCSVAQFCPTLCDPKDCSMPGFPVLHHLLEFAQTHVHCVSDDIQPSHLLSSHSPPAFNLSQHQGLFQ